MQVIKRAALVFLANFALMASAMAEDMPRIAPRPLTSALHAVAAKRWDDAVRLAARDGPAAQTLVQWYRLRAGEGTAEEVAAFLARHADWPGLNVLRAKSELAMADAAPAEIVDFYAGGTPQTGLGALSYARALIHEGRLGEADVTAVLAWRTLDLSPEEHLALLETFRTLLAPHHAARLDMALWRGLDDVADMLPLVDPPHRAIARVRLAIDQGAEGSDALLAALPTAARDNPHIAHALFMRHIRQGRSDAAIELLLHQSALPAGLGDASRWAGWRRELARAQMRAGAERTAYDLASRHGLVEGAHYADLEWLSGYIALQYMKAPDLALDHFQRFLAAVEAPISLGRAGYWIGRAQEAAGDPEAAAIAYELGALHQTSFYGQLAAEKGGFPPDPVLRGAEDFGPWRAAVFARRDAFQAGVLALAAGRAALAERFFTHLAGILPRRQLGQLGQAMADLGSPHLQVMVGKAGAQRGLTLPGMYYPLHPMADLDLAVAPELALAIARRESEFDPNVASAAGAMGLMQLMPGTAREMVRATGAGDYSRERLFGDWAHNARLGAAYLARLGDQFDGNVVLVAAAYNAGPSRATRWMSEFGDPRREGGDVVDWIEHIPFAETRNYVMRVAESLPVYRARLGQPPHPVPFSAELKGATIQPRTR